MKKLLLLFAVCMAFTACNSNNSQSSDSQQGNEAQTDTCWKQSAEVLPGLKADVTTEGGVKLVWTDWDKFMGVLENSFDSSYPFDSPLTDQEIENLGGKVKGLAVMGNPMAPMLYMLLEDNSVQLYSIYEMYSRWDFYAGSIVGHDIVNVKTNEKDNEFFVTVLVDKNGKEIVDDNFIVDDVDLWGYSENDDELKVEQMKIGNDGSITYIHKYMLYDQEYEIYHGYITNFKRNDGDGSTYEYHLTLQDAPDDVNMYKKVDIKGEFTMKYNNELDGHYTVIPKSGLNMAGFDNAKLGEPRDMLVEARIKEYLGE